MKKGGGTGPVKPWQPAVTSEKVPNPIRQLTEEISIQAVFQLLPLLHSL